MDTKARVATDAVLEVARSWAAIEGVATEVDPIELARWFASWRADLGDADPGPFSDLIEEAMSVDGSGHPVDFVDWFIDWRRDVLKVLEAVGHGERIAGLPLHSALSVLHFQFEDDLPREVGFEIEDAIETLEAEGFGAAAAARAVLVVEKAQRLIRGRVPTADMVGRVHRDMALIDIRRRLSEYGRLAR